MRKLETLLKNMKVKKKLFLLAATLIGGIMVIGIVGIAAVATLNNHVTTITSNYMQASNRAQEMNVLTSNYRIYQYAHIASETEESMQEFESLMEQTANEIADASAAYEALILEEDDRELLMNARNLWSEYKEHGEQLLELSRDRKITEANEMMLGELRDIYNSFDASIGALVQYNEDNCDNAARVAHATFITVIGILVTVVVVCLLTAILVVKIVGKSITEPLAKVTEALGQVSKGVLDTHVEYESKDEFGSLATGVNQHIEELESIIGDINYLLKEMSEGNFNIKSRATEKYIGDFSIILQSLRGIHGKLGGAMEKIAESTNQVTVASEQLAAEAQALADGATEQASTVEELLASVEEASNKAVSSAAQAEQQAKDAYEVRKKAENSNERMNDMVHAMDKINETSKEISTIIQTIEDIASQTNLLSLNASIEAARAGEAGRGFAVVADAIGKLAAQSAEAAGNTKELIETAIKEIGGGDLIAKETAEELFTVTEGVVKIVDVAREVKESCENQAEAMKQINEGIEIISRVVESNSAAAEESSASSEELAAHAENLQEQMAQFRFRD